MTATLMSVAQQACRPTGRILTLVTLVMVLEDIPRPVPPVFAHTPARAIRQATCAAGVPAPAVCDRVLGVALTLPKGWSVVPREKFPPGYLAFWTLIPGSQEPPSHLVIELVGLASACTDTQAALAVAEALARTTANPHPIMRRRSIVAGAPAVYLYDLPATPKPSVQIVVAHRGAVYQLIFPGSSRAVRPDQWYALASLRFIPRIGPFPRRPDDPFLTTALRRCARAQTAQLFLENVWRRSLLMLSITGKDFAPQEVVTVRLSWHGTPAAAATPRYTTYTTPSSALIRRGGS